MAFDDVVTTGIVALFGGALVWAAGGTAPGRDQIGLVGFFGAFGGFGLLGGGFYLASDSLRLFGGS